MKNFKTTVIIVVIALYSQFANSQTTSKAANLPRSFKMGLNRAFGEYIELKDALLQKDIKKANHEAKELLDAANAIKTDSLTKDQQSEFNKYIFFFYSFFLYLPSSIKLSCFIINKIK